MVKIVVARIFVVLAWLASLLTFGYSLIRIDWSNPFQVGVMSGLCFMMLSFVLYKEVVPR